MILQYHSWAYIMRKTWSKRTHASQCLLQFCLQLSRHGNNLNIHQQNNGQGRGDIYIQWNITQPLKRMKWCHLHNMDGPRDYHTEWSNSGREREILYDITYMQYQKIQMNLRTKQKQTHIARWVGGWGKIVREFGIDI